MADSNSCLKDGGTRQTYAGGGMKEQLQINKGRFDLLPPYAIQRLAVHFANGAAKYADRNWEKGIPLSRFMDSGLRHALQYLGGARDEDHMAAAAWNFLCLIQTEEWIRLGVLPQELNDLPTYVMPKNILGNPIDNRLKL
ncbi:MAG: dATP/dGTP diphosphohydrolase domain-containing protein [Dehalogenimonas sp.]